ncbi:MAG: WD40 repeat domain-containing protein [Spirochaeta sp.]|nr:WD40 repeat domain-containing protein [Spirochaeta sp.]
MKRFMLLVTFIILLIIGQNADASDERYRLYPAVGHWGEIHEIEYSAGLARLVTAGEDGTIRVWTTDVPRLVRAHSISPYALTHLALHPELPHAAVIENSGTSRPLLSVWNWETGSSVFRTELQAKPLSIAYSPKGSFLVSTFESRDSVVLMSPDTGEIIEHGVQRTGIVSDFTVSGSETTLMAYTPGNGRFTYYNIQDGRVLQTVHGEARLERLNILPNNRLAVAVQDSEILLVDILRGSVLNRIAIPNIRSLAINKDSSDISVLHRQDGRFYYRTWQIHQNRLQERRNLVRELNRPPVVSEFFNDKLLIASEDGTLSYYFARSRYPRILSADRRLAVHGLAYSAGFLYLQSDDTFLQFSDLSSASASKLGVSLRTLSESSLRLPTEGSYSIHGALLDKLWFRRTDLLQPFLYQLPTGHATELTPFNHEFDSNILGVEVTHNRILVETAADQVLLWNPRTDQIEYTHSTPEISAYAYHPVHGLSIGTNSAAGSGRTLLHINPDTGETIPLSIPAFITTDIVFSNDTGSLYALGLEQSSAGELYTRLDRWSGSGFAQHENLYRSPGADWTAQLASVPASDDVWFLPASGRIQVWNNQNRHSLDAEGEFYQEIGVNGDLVYAVHRSGAVSFYSASQKQKLLTLYLFRDREWLALTPDPQTVQPPPSLTRFRLPLPVVDHDSLPHDQPVDERRR